MLQFSFAKDAGRMGRLPWSVFAQNHRPKLPKLANFGGYWELLGMQCSARPAGTSPKEGK